MIGRVTYPGGLIATLGDDCTWTVRGGDGTDRPGFARVLDEACRAAYAGPQAGPYGANFLDALAARVGGTAEFEPKPALPPGTIY